MNKIDTVTIDVDTDLLKSQGLIINNLITELGGTKRLTALEKDSLEGLLSMIDIIADKVEGYQ